MDIKITWETILALSGGILILINLAKAIINMSSPFKKANDRLNDHELKLNNDYKEINDLKVTLKILCKVQLAMLEHEISGNHIDKLKETKKELQEFLIER